MFQQPHGDPWGKVLYPKTHRNDAIHSTEVLTIPDWFVTSSAINLVRDQPLKTIVQMRSDSVNGTFQDYYHYKLLL